MQCERCKKETIAWRMSFFNTQQVCLDCIEEEKAHELYQCAKEVERWHCNQKDYNYIGIGLPTDLCKKYNCEPHNVTCIDKQQLDLIVEYCNSGGCAMDFLNRLQSECPNKVAETGDEAYDAIASRDACVACWEKALFKH